MNLWPLLAAFGLLVVATICDWRSREIPDWIAIGIVVMALIGAATGAASIRWWMVPSGGALGLAVGAAMFRWAAFGGGDAKLIAATGTIVGPLGLLIVLFWMACVGGLLAGMAGLRGQRDYAYAPAIAAGFAAYLVYPCVVWRVLM